VDYPGLLRTAERGQPPPVVLLHGTDVQLLDDAIEATTRGLFRDATEAGLGREVFDGREATVDAIVRSALTLPFLAGARLVVVRRSQLLAARSAEALQRYAAAPNPTTCVLLLADEPLGASRERRADHWLLRAVPPAMSIALPARRGRALEEWVRERAGRAGLTVSDDAARLLVQWVGDDGARLLAEVQKAALAGGADNRAVGVTEVTAVVGEQRMSGVFDLTRAVERRDTTLALRTLDRLLATEEPMLILALLTRELRTAWTVIDLRARGQSMDQIARAVRRPAPVLDALATATGSVASLATRLESCWRVERRLKSGGAAAAELSVLVAELCRR
jgi:DNA polymerase-3 subunit delta